MTRGGQAVFSDAQGAAGATFAAWRSGESRFAGVLMFTGIVEETGRVVSFEPRAEAWRLVVSARVALEDLAAGDSIAVNGCCLTATRASDGVEHASGAAGAKVGVGDGSGAGLLQFDVLEETRRLTNFAKLKPGARVNLERSLRFGGKVGGHFVTGHIDAQGEIEAFEARGKDFYVRVRVPAGMTRYIVHKGSIALDGISLTIAEVTDAAFAVWIIPHTRAVTNLSEKQVGDPVNLEFDLLGKHVEKLLATRTN